jgi:hypothetical protein
MSSRPGWRTPPSRPGTPPSRGWRNPPVSASARLFADPTSGHLTAEDVWEDPHALAGSRSAAAVARVDAATDCAIRAVEEYVQVFSSVRKP